MSKNKNVKIALEKKYGKGCMFEKAEIEKQINTLNKNAKKRAIKTYKKYKEEKKFTSKKIIEMEKMISVHHLRHRSENGDTSVENCTLINRLAHDYIHSLPREDEEIINNELRKYKLNNTKSNNTKLNNTKLNIAKLNTNDTGIVDAEPLDQITFEDLGIDCIEIPLIENTIEDIEYIKHKKSRNERIFKKFQEFEER